MWNPEVLETPWPHNPTAPPQWLIDWCVGHPACNMAAVAIKRWPFHTLDVFVKGCFVELGESAGWHFSGEKWALWAKKWPPLHAKHIAGLLITCLGPCKQPNACRHASPLAFFENVMLQQQRMHFTKWAARTQKIQTGCWGQQTGPFKSDEQGCGGKKQT